MLDSSILINGINLSIRRLKARESGGKPELVFLHDSLGCITTWGNFPDALSERLGLSCLVYDRQGHGNSDPHQSKDRDADYHKQEAEILISLLRSLSIERPILFGHSDGGTIALIAAALYPKYITGVISEAGHVFLESKTIDGILAAKDYYAEHKGLTSRLAKHHGEKAGTLLESWTENWLKPQFRNWNIEHYLPDIQCPTLVIQGEDDEFATISQVESICSKISGPAVPCVLADIGHIPHKAAREEVLNVVEKFILRYCV